MFYSKSTGGFYSREMHGSAMPEDVVAITEAEHSSLLAGQSLGKQIVADNQGAPMLADRPAPPRAEQVAQVLAAARALRQPIMGVLDGMQASALTLGDTAQAQAIETAKRGLRDLTSIDLSGAATGQHMEAAIYARYRTIAAALPAPLQVAFARVVE